HGPSAGGARGGQHAVRTARARTPAAGLFHPDAGIAGIRVAPVRPQQHHRQHAVRADLGSDAGGVCHLRHLLSGRGLQAADHGSRDRILLRDGHDEHGGLRRHHAANPGGEAVRGVDHRAGRRGIRHLADRRDRAPGHPQPATHRQPEGPSHATRKPFRRDRQHAARAQYLARTGAPRPAGDPAAATGAGNPDSRHGRQRDRRTQRCRRAAQGRRRQGAGRAGDAGRRFRKRLRGAGRARTPGHRAHHRGRQRCEPPRARAAGAAGRGDRAADPGRRTRSDAADRRAGHRRFRDAEGIPATRRAPRRRTQAHGLSPTRTCKFNGCRAEVDGMNDWLQHGQWLGNSALAWVVAGAAALGGYAIAHVVAAIVAARLRKLAERTHRNGFAIAARVAEATRGWLLLLIAIAIALDFLHFGDAAATAGRTPRWTVRDGLQLITYTLVGVQIALWIIALVVAWLHRSTSGETTRPVNPVMLGVLTWAVQFVVWVTLVLALLAEGGVN